MFRMKMKVRVWGVRLSDTSQSERGGECVRKRRGGTGCVCVCMCVCVCVPRDECGSKGMPREMGFGLSVPIRVGG